MSRAGTAALVLLGAVLLVRAAAGVAEAAVIERVVARVGDEVILQSEVDLQERVYLQQLQAGPAASPAGAGAQESRQAVLKDIIEERLLLQRAKQLGIKAEDRQIDEFVDTIKKEHKLTTQDELLLALRGEGLSYQEFRQNLSKRIVLETIRQQEVAPLVVVTEDEARKYYDEHKKDFTQEERLRLGEIVLLVQPDRPKEEVRKQAERVYDLLRSGVDFAELATFVSQTPSSVHGGDLGYVERGILAPEIETIAFSLKEGEMSEPVETSFGYHILKALGRKDESPDAYDAVKPEIQGKLKDEKFTTMFQSYIDGLRSKTYVEILSE